MSEQTNRAPEESAENSSSGLLLSVQPLEGSEPSKTLKLSSDDADASDATDADESDAADGDGTDGTDGDGTDGSASDGTDAGKTDGTDGLVDADGSDS